MIEVPKTKNVFKCFYKQFKDVYMRYLAGLVFEIRCFML